MATNNVSLDSQIVVRETCGGCKGTRKQETPETATCLTTGCYRTFTPQELHDAPDPMLLPCGHSYESKGYGDYVYAGVRFDGGGLETCWDCEGQGYFERIITLRDLAGLLVNVLSAQMASVVRFPRERKRRGKGNTGGAF